MATSHHGTVGILVGGGPAPGINGVIASVTFYAARRGYHVLGIMEGFRWLIQPDAEEAKLHTMELTIASTELLHQRGGSIVHTSRINPTRSVEHLKNVVANLKALGVGYLVTIGGDDTAHSSVCCAKQAEWLKVVHVPKTIDNDLPLPGNIPTFGYTTACQVGAEILTSLLADARSTLRWYIVETMGRQSGALPMGMCSGAGCQLCIIPEQFRDKRVTFKDICDIIETTLYKRDALGQPYGVIVVAEGLTEYMDEEERKNLCKGQLIPLDPHGHIRLDKLNLALGITTELEHRFATKNLNSYGLTFKKLGYEVRCHDPVAFDVEYTRDLGFGAMKLLEMGLSGKMIVRDIHGFTPYDLESLTDPTTGRIKNRAVDCLRWDYQVARSFMFFLETWDLEEGAGGLLERMTKIAKFESPTAFAKTFAHVPALFPKKKFPGLMHDSPPFLFAGATAPPTFSL
eukprot:TRINITY_DN7468_c0_g1_i2.p1 TRINITY_DN7468_c0_g1~~TRINITY_DN7468_c0_g1_i2.p1  ORF type:complete len:458 (+),score=132.80 TRINITY_DN7468_c0_g1_i2:174-1547(+)